MTLKKDSINLSKKEKFLPQDVSLPLIALILLLNLAVALALGLHQTVALQRDAQNLYADSATPMLTSFDSFYYLRLSHDLAASNYARQDPLAAFDRPWPAPLMVTVVAGLSKNSGVRLEVLAFVFPAAAAATLAAVMLLWAYAFAPRGPATGLFLFTTTLAATLSPYWVETASVGAFDTNALIPQLFLLTGWSFYKFAVTRTAQRWLFVAGFLGCWYLFGRWWTPGFGVGLLYVAAYAATFLLETGRCERGVKIVLLCSLLLFFGSALFGVPGFLPASLGDPLRYVHKHVALVLKLSAPGDMGAIGASIIELSGLSPGELAEESAGHVLVFVVALAGLMFAPRRNPAAFAFLVPFLLFGLVALRANRFVTLFFPVVALGLGLAIVVAAERLGRLRPAAWLLAALALAPLAAHAVGFAPTPQFSSAADGLALAIRAKTPADALVWTWWDYGYFLQCRAGRKTLFDGGSQTADRYFVVGRGIVEPDARLAANWIRFFAARGVAAYYQLSRQCGGNEKAVRFLEDGLSGRRDAVALKAAHPGVGIPDLDSYLFPEVTVCLYLPWHLMRINGHWLSHGTRYSPTPMRFRNHVDVFPREGFGFDFANNRATLSTACAAKGYVAFPTLARAPVSGLEAATLVGRPAPFLIAPDESPYVFIAGPQAASSLAFRLLVLRESIPGFRLLSFDLQAGGVWEVEKHGGAQ